MEAIYIPQLTKAPEQTEVIQFADFLPDLATLTPVRGCLQIQHCGNYLDVSVQAETIITLTCHRCLQQYNYRLVIDTSEMIWLEETEEELEKGAIEREIAVEDLVETLPPQGFFHPGEWLYEQMCLELPQRQLCDINCVGIQPAPSHSSEPTVDHRWASLKSLKNNSLN